MSRKVKILVWSSVVLWAAVAASYLYLDIPAAQWSRALDPATKAVFESLTGFGVSTWYLVASALGFAWFRWRRARLLANRCLFFFSAIALSGVAVNLAKVILGRSRPVLLWQSGEYGFAFFRLGYEFNAFPSGHAATIFSIAACLALFFPRARLPLYLFACLVAVSRVALGSHFPADVLAGAWFGLATVFLLQHAFHSPAAVPPFPFREPSP